MADIKKTAGKPAEQMIKIRLPRDRQNNSDLFVSVNERTFLIKRGVEVEVPACVAEVIRHSEAMDEYAYEYSSAAESK